MQSVCTVAAPNNARYMRNRLFNLILMTSCLDTYRPTVTPQLAGVKQAKVVTLSSASYLRIHDLSSTVVSII